MFNRFKKSRVVLVVIVSVLIICVLWNVYEYFALKKEAAYYLNKRDTIDLSEPVDLVGLLDSYGVPYSPSVDKSFFGYLEEDLKEVGLLSSSLDLYGLYINKTWELNGIFRNDVTIGEMKTMQNFGMDFVRHKYGKERIREDLVYTCDETLEDVTVASYYSELKRPVVLYSCAANDLFYYFNTSLESLNAAKLLKIIMNFGNGLSLLESEVRSNLETLTAYNPNAVIIVMGLYVPSDKFFLHRVGNVAVSTVNSMLEDACNDYNAHYVDVSCMSFGVLNWDFHPNNEGHLILKNILKSKLSSMELQGYSTPTSFVERKETDRDSDPYGTTIDEMLIWLDKGELPQNDYVECAVALEKALSEEGLDDISYYEFKKLWRNLPSNISVNINQGMEILAIEKKIHDGFNYDQQSG